MQSLFKCLFLLVIVPVTMRAQDTLPKQKKEPVSKKSVEYKQAATKLEESFNKNDESKIAGNYEDLAQKIVSKNPAKAEEYLNKALAIYVKLKDTRGQAKVRREIAKIQESQQKFVSAGRNYKAAEEVSMDKVSEMMNSNDYKRVQQPDNAAVQERYLNSNIVIGDRNKRKDEVADAFVKQAEISLKNNDSTVALEQLKKALPYVKDEPEKAAKISNKIASLYSAGDKFTEAVSVIKGLLGKARKAKDTDTEITQLQALAAVYFKNKEAEYGVSSLKEAYKIASDNGKTLEARETLLKLTDHYKTTGNDKASLEMYSQFLQNLDRILLSDNSLTDAKTFKVTEERIRRLENEKKLKDELIGRKNTFNYFLIGAVAVLLLLFGFIVRALYFIRIRNKEIALQSLRREMNPHFIFNSLNSVNQFIAQNNELEANKYLTSYSNLMRNNMENSNKDFVTLANETENLSKYLELEHMRFKDKFDYTITVDEALDPDAILIPNMVIQPHLENAIWHGLRYKEQKGLLKLSFRPDGQYLLITIDDDGIGPTRSAELKTDNQKVHHSRGITNTKERIALLNQLYKTDIHFEMEEKKLPETGTIVRIKYKLINKL